MFLVGSPHLGHLIFANVSIPTLAHLIESMPMLCIERMCRPLKLLFLNLLIYSMENLKIQDCCNIGILPLPNCWRPMYLNKFMYLNKVI